MNGVLVDHPDGWVGIPTLPNDRWSTVRAWSEELVESYEVAFGAPTPEQADTMTDYLDKIVATTGDRGADRSYIYTNGWAGPLFLVDMNVLEGAGWKETTIELLVNAEDPDAVEKPITRAFTTDSGLEGLSSVRYLDAPGVGGIVAAADVAIRISNGYVLFRTAQVDLVAFEKVVRLLEALAQTVRLAP